MVPRISVVIPTYNRARDLERAITSVLAQTFDDFEVLVIDNQSTDDTAAVVAQFSDRRISLHSVDNQGVVAKSRNMGIHLARGEYVAFLDSDDWWTRTKLRVSLDSLESGAAVVFHHLYLVTHPRQRVHLRKVRARDLRRPVFRDLLHNGSAIPQSSVVMRRDLLVEVGGMPEDRELVAMEDYMCWLNAARLTEKFLRVRGTLGYYWAGGGNLSSDARMIAILDRVMEVYRTEPRAMATAQMPPWIAYAYGRAHYNLGDYQTSLRHIALIDPATAPFMIVVRATLTKAAIALSAWRRPTHRK
jgi:GT2 family glycosyltransferase